MVIFQCYKCITFACNIFIFFHVNAHCVQRKLTLTIVCWFDFVLLFVFIVFRKVNMNNSFSFFNFFNLFLIFLALCSFPIVMHLDILDTTFKLISNFTNFFFHQLFFIIFVSFEPLVKSDFVTVLYQLRINRWAILTITFSTAFSYWITCCFIHQVMTLKMVDLFDDHILFEYHLSLTQDFHNLDINKKPLELDFGWCIPSGIVCNGTLWKMLNRTNLHLLPEFKFHVIHWMSIATTFLIGTDFLPPHFYQHIPGYFNQAM